MEKENEEERSASLNYSSTIDEGFRPGYIAVDVVSIVLLVCGLVANVSICSVLLHRKRLLKTFANFHLFNLALTNLVFRTFLAPIVLQRNDMKSGNEVLCKLQVFANFTTLAVTFALLAGISAHLYFNIKHPFKARNISWKHSGALVILSWVYAALCTAPLLPSLKYENANPEEDLYGECEQKKEATTSVWRTVFLLFAFIAPLIVIAVSYGFVLRAMDARLKNSISSSSRAIARSKKKTLRMIILVALSYVLTWGPKLMWFVLEGYGLIPDEEAIDEEISEDSVDAEEALHKWKIRMLCQTIVEVIANSSSVLNPVIFGYYSQNFREGFRQLFCKKNRSKPPTSRAFKNKIEQSPKELPENLGDSMDTML